MVFLRSLNAALVLLLFISPALGPNVGCDWLNQGALEAPIQVWIVHLNDRGNRSPFYSRSDPIWKFTCQALVQTVPGLRSSFLQNFFFFLCVQRNQTGERGGPRLRTAEQRGSRGLCSFFCLDRLIVFVRASSSIMGAQLSHSGSRAEPAGEAKTNGQVQVCVGLC